MLLYTRPKPYRSLHDARKSVDQNRRGTLNYVASTSFVVAIWIIISSSFAIGYLSYFGMWTVKFFSILDLQYLSFSTMIYALPFIILIFVLSFQFLIVSLDPAGKPIGLAFLKKNTWKVVFFVATVPIALVIFSLPFAVYHFRSFIPIDSVLYYLQDGSIVPSFLAGFIGIFGIYTSRLQKNMILALSLVIILTMISSILYVIGNTFAAFKNNGSINVEVAQFKDSKEKFPILALGENYVLLKNENKAIEIRHTSEILAVRNK